MPYKDPEKQKAYDRARLSKRRKYFREYQRSRRRRGLNKKYKSHGDSIGYKAEELGLKILVGSKRIYRPSDLKWEGKLIDVKTAIKQHGHFIQWTTKESKQSSTYRWRFSLEKQFRKVDLYLIICQDKNYRVEHIFLIPDKILNKKNLSISENRIAKYSQYRLSL